MSERHGASRRSRPEPAASAVPLTIRIFRLDNALDAGMGRKPAASAVPLTIRIFRLDNALDAGMGQKPAASAVPLRKVSLTKSFTAL